MTDGKKANERGIMLESIVTGLLKDGYKEVPAKDFCDQIRFNNPIFSKQCYIGKNLYGNRRRVDFVLFHPEKWKNKLIIQCKWQSSSGSVEEKFAFEISSIKIGKIDTIIVLDGGGYSSNAESWLKSHVGKDNLLHVMNLGEFHRFQSKKYL